MTAQPTPPGRVANPPTPARGAAPHATARFWTVWLVLMAAAVAYLQVR